MRKKNKTCIISLGLILGLKKLPAALPTEGQEDFTALIPEECLLDVCSLSLSTWEFLNFVNLVFVQVMKFLTPKQLGQSMRVNRLWRRICGDLGMWRSHIKLDFNSELKAKLHPSFKAWSYYGTLLKQRGDQDQFNDSIDWWGSY